MRETGLLFLISILIILAGLLFGFAQIENSYSVDENFYMLAIPFEGNLELSIVKLQ